MRRRTLIILYALIIVLAGCGKKGPPVYFKRSFNAVVQDLSVSESNGKLTVKGKINYHDKISKEDIAGSRIYLSEFKLKNRPCSGCPIKYQRYFEQGREVIKGDTFLWTLSGIKSNRVYVLKVHLISKEGQPGPPSERVEIITSGK